MKKIIDFLRKTGFLQMSKGDWNSGEFDTRKDLKGEAKTKKDGQKKETGEKNKKGRKVFFWLAVVLAFIFLLSSLSSGVGIFILNLIFWLIFLFLLKKYAFFGSYNLGIMIVAFVLILIISLSTLGVEEKDLSKGEDLEKYVGKIYELKSADGKFWGLVGMVGVTESQGGKQYLEAQFNIKINDNLPANGKCPVQTNGCSKGTFHYDYANNLVEPNKKYKEAGEGQLSNTQCNEKALPEDPMSYNPQLYQCSIEEQQEAMRKPSTYFDAAFTKKYTSIEDFLAINKFEVYDGADFWVVEKEEGANRGTTTTGSIETNKAVAEGEMVAEYDFVITEK